MEIQDCVRVWRSDYLWSFVACVHTVYYAHLVSMTGLCRYVQQVSGGKKTSYHVTTLFPSMPPEGPPGSQKGAPKKAPRKHILNNYVIYFLLVLFCYYIFYMFVNFLHVCYIVVTCFLILLAGLAGRPPEEAHGRPPEEAHGRPPEAAPQGRRHICRGYVLSPGALGGSRGASCRLPGGSPGAPWGRGEKRQTLNL